MADPVNVLVNDNGPLMVEGDFKLVTPSGKQIAIKGKKAFLCRCGASTNKPFCDGRHKSIGFTASEQDVAS
jgi:CDGSH-type Zn-finger protein